MTDSTLLGLLLFSFSAGLLSFLSPCVLPLIPSYVTFITGMSMDEVQQARRSALVHSLLFIAGFTLIFLALGATATVFGRVLLVYRDWISRIGGVLIILFGLYLLGAFQFAFLLRERRMHIADKPMGYLGTVLVGIAFGAGWTPCIGPILGSILILTSSSAELGKGLLLLFVYSLGLAIPFLVASLTLNHFLTAYAKVRRHLVWVNRVAGVLLIIVGLLLVTDYFTVLAGYLQALTPDFLRDRI
ncbi:MAG TPA: cytochrome c biogenesis protein CcdA [Gemmatimonadaceae bacterium]|nr:cytochrome c biogenesis protein CcdA [Gemmatimonadaceae bacterium]